MSYRIETLPDFDRAVKRLLKKHPSLKQDLQQLVSTLIQQPTQGQSLGRSCYKIRLAIGSKNQGKSGGARVITCVVAVAPKVVLVAIYDKSERATISDHDLHRLAQLAAE